MIKLTFATERDRLQAEQLMQPCFIRVVDNLRKQTEELDWRSEYVEQLLWPEGTTTEQQQQVADLTASLKQATPEEAQRLEQALAQLPTPTPAYQLRLSHEDRTAALDLWGLCFQICFQTYDPKQPVAVDSTLLGDDNEVDWLTLDEKAKTLIALALAQATSAQR